MKLLLRPILGQHPLLGPLTLACLEPNASTANSSHSNVSMAASTVPTPSTPHSPLPRPAALPPLSLTPLRKSEDEEEDMDVGGITELEFAAADVQRQPGLRLYPLFVSPSQHTSALSFHEGQRVPEPAGEGGALP